MCRRLILPATFLLLLVYEAGAAQQNTVAKSAASAATVEPAATSGRATVPAEKASPVRLPRFEKPPTIDGKLHDDAWTGAALFTDFYQTHPGDNAAPTNRTEVRMGYDSKMLFLAFRAYDEASKVRATVPKRDQIFGDDYVKVILDTFNDKRRAYELAFNPLGVQADAVFTDGVDTDFSVDIVMESKGVVDKEGYTVEVAIPFESLRYIAGKDRFWGINFYRRVQRGDSETNSWMPISRDKTALLSQFGQITGLDGIDAGRTLEIIPSLTLSESGRRVPTLSAVALASNPTLRDAGRFVNSPVGADIGLTLKYSLSSTLTLDFAANPDFAQVEADQPVVTANQRFPIYFSEKRPFFLEGIDIFQTPIQAVHTRAIVDPDYAVKLTGKQGKHSFGILLASDNAPGNFSDEERQDPDAAPDIARFLDKNAYVGVLRYKRDVGSESSVGVLATSYDFVEKHNRVAGVDGRLRLDKQTTLTFQVLTSHSRAFFHNVEQDHSEYRKGVGTAYSWGLGKFGRRVGFGFYGSGTTADYRSEVGFTPRTDTHSNYLNFSYRTEPKPNARLISWGIHNGSYLNYDGKGRSQSAGYNGNLNLSLPKQTFVGVGWNVNYERIFEEEFGAKRATARAGAFFGEPERSLRGGSVNAYAEINPSRKYSLGGFFSRRRNAFDFDFGAGPDYPRVSPAALADPHALLDPGAADAWDVNFYFSYQPTAALGSSLSFSRNQYIRKDTGRTVFVSNIYSWSAKYQFSRFLFARSRLDYSTLGANVSGQYLFGWTPSPGTAFYAGYNDSANWNGYSPFTSHREPGYHLNSRTFFVKMSYLFRRSM